MADRIKIILFACISLSAIVATCLLPPFAQSLEYHNFVDQRTFLNIPNALNVLSNIPFVVIGLFGIAYIKRHASITTADFYRHSLIFFGGVFLTGLGSAYYHFAPSNHTLLWDRLPMTIAFMAFFSFVVGLWISRRAGNLLLWPLLILGIVAAGYWHWSETQGAGDLRWYVLVQFLPIILTPLILWWFPSPFASSKPVWLMLAWYITAKLLETADAWIYAHNHFVSGHSLKHIAAAIATFYFLRLVQSLYK